MFAEEIEEKRKGESSLWVRGQKNEVSESTCWKYFLDLMGKVDGC